MLKFFLPFLLLIPMGSFTQVPIRPDSAYRTPVIVEDDPVVIMLDSLASLKIFKDAMFPNAEQYQNWSNYTDTEIPSFPDSVYRERLALMNDQSPFEYVFNPEVKQFIDLYAVRKRKLTARILGLSQIYFPLFEEQLDKYNMPLELKYLAVIESALNPVASSHAGAKGLWQFMYGTGKVYGLKLSTYVDDRYDPYKSTIAACEHLQDLYDIYGNWSLALAAYNSGAGNVNKAIRRSGGIKNFWAIQKYLPRETASYVPAFIAASYVMTYANDHKIFPVDPGILYYEVDTVTVTRPLSFAQISEMLNIPMDEIVFLNPAFKQKMIPATVENPYKLRLRKKDIGNFINNEQALYAYRTREGLMTDSLEKQIWKNYRETEFYTVKSGETPSSVAKKFGMTVSELRNLNGLGKSNHLKPKRKLLVYTKVSRQKPKENIASTYVPQIQKPDSVTAADSSASGPEMEATASGTVTEVTPPEARTTVHVVKKGESLGLIANRYKCTINDLTRWNNLTTTNILVGQKLKVSMPAGTTIAQRSALAAKSASGSGNSGGKYIWYTIRSGDTLWEIADKHDVTVSQIKALNKLKNHSRIQVGQKIKIPR